MGAKKGDTGHAINANNVGKLVDALKDLGADYLPPSPSLETAALEKEVEPSKDVVKVVASPKETFDSTGDKRRDQAVKVKGILRNAQGNLEATDGVTKDQIGRYKTVYKLFTGGNVRDNSRRKKKAAAAKAGATTTDPQETNEAPEVTEQEHSVSQQSFEKKVANGYDAVSILESIPNYKPKDPLAATEYIRSEIDIFNNLNLQVDKDYKPYSAVLKARDTKLYAPETGSVVKAKKIKAFISKSKAFSASQKKIFVDIKFKVPSAKNLHL